jgi:hypothetical protein
LTIHQLPLWSAIGCAARDRAAGAGAEGPGSGRTAFSVILIETHARRALRDPAFSQAGPPRPGGATWDTRPLGLLAGGALAPGRAVAGAGHGGEDGRRPSPSVDAPVIGVVLAAAAQAVMRAGRGAQVLGATAAVLFWSCRRSSGR